MELGGAAATSSEQETGGVWSKNCIETIDDE